MNAGLIFGRVEDEFCLAVFLGHCVIAVDHNLPIGLPIGRYSITEHRVVNHIGKERDREHGQNCDCQQSLEERFNLRL